MSHERLVRNAAVLIAGVFLSTGCGGRDGLSEKEYGYILFWEVTSADLVWHECTDADQFRGAISAPEFEDNSFIVYRVSDDGDTLVDQDCESIDASTCKDSDLGIVFEKADDGYAFDPPLAVGDELAPNCSLTSDPRWLLDDQGQDLFLDVSLTFGLQGEGTACDGVDENVAKSGTNEFGIDGCTATIEVVGDYYTRRRVP